MHTEDWIPSLPATTRFTSSKQQKHYLCRVSEIPVCCIIHTVLFSRLFLSCLGWQVGSDPEIQVASVVSNHLTAGIMRYFGDSFRLQQAANLFEKVSVKEPEVASLLGRSYIGMSA